MTFAQRKELAKQIPIENIISRYVNLQREGRHLVGLCPFHQDTNLGSFKVTPAKQIWRCFACGTGGDAIDFVMKYEKVGIKDAVNKILGENYDVDKPLEVRTPSFLPKNRLPSNILNKVYHRLFQLIPISAEDREYLIKRGVPANTLYKFGRIPDRLTRYKIAKILYEEFGDILFQVPGFYINKKGKPMLNGPEGIALAIYDGRGYFVGIQIRKDVVKSSKKESRYYWLSSVNMGGQSPGSRVSVYIPSVMTSTKILITEGIFKQIIAGEHFQCRTISIQGIGNWREFLFENLSELSATEIVLAADADITKTKEVKTQVKNLVLALKKSGFKVSILKWKLKSGKGIDDVILASKGKAFQQGKNYRAA